MEVILNGQPLSTQATTLAELLTERKIPTAGTAIALHNRVIPRAAWEQTPLSEGALITLIRATQGG